MKKLISKELYILHSRVLTHLIFWMLYYVFFSLLWAKDGNLFASFQLEFVLMPIRIAASYISLYYLIPQFLAKEKPVKFLLLYTLLVVIGGGLQRVLTFYFHEFFFLENTQVFSISSIVRSIVLVNSTVLFLSALKVYKHWMGSKNHHALPTEKPLEIRSDKRFYKVMPSDILYIEGLGNYLTIYTENKKALISYMTLKEAESTLPDSFHRIHKSFIINRDHIQSYNHENVEIDDRIIPIGKSYAL